MTLKMKNTGIAFMMIFTLAACAPQGASTTSGSGSGSGTTPGSQSSGDTSRQVSLAWQSNAGEQQGFSIEQSTDGVNFKQVLSVLDGVNNAKVTVPAAGKYYFRVKGYNQAGVSPYTTVLSVQVAG